jgi:hypothetical protein
VSEGIKEAMVYGTLGFVFILFVFVMPLTVAQNHKRDCINVGMQKNYTASDIVNICGRH